MSLAGVVVAVLAGTLSLLRWLRVSQREHYLPGAATLSARRWVAARPPNLPLVLAWVVLVIASLALSRSAPDIAMVVGVLAAAVGTIFPIGMSIVGTPRLRPTRRATFQAGMAVLLTTGAVTAVALALGAGPGAALAPGLAGLSVDAGAWVNRPIERRIAARYRRAADEKMRRARPRVVAITGSYGKTTVKHHVRDLVATTFDTLVSPASWNNLAGLSRAVNEHLTATTEVFVAEMGTYGPGEIEEMVEWLRPEIAVITALGPVHLERMRDLETIAAAKSEILQGARAAVICVDDPLLREVAERVARERSPGELWMVGSDATQTDLDVLVCDPSPGEHPEKTPRTLTIWLGGEPVTELPRGSLHPSNVACAAAAALALGVDRRVLLSTLPKLAAPPSRTLAAVTDIGITVVDDTFNSNPSGALAALSTLNSLVADGRRVVITPGMVELGHLQPRANRHFAEQVAASGADLVVVGWTNRGALVAGHPGAVPVPDRAAARRWMRDNLTRGDGVLWENDLPDHYP